MGTPGTWKKAVINGMLGMSFLLLFVPQLSYKFYLCVNNPSWTFKAQNRPRVSHEQTTVDRSIAYEHCRPLSLDKRYCLVQNVGILPVELRPVDRNSCEPVHGVCAPAVLACLSGPARALRGPPTGSSFR